MVGKVKCLLQAMIKTLEGSYKMKTKRKLIVSAAIISAIAMAVNLFAELGVIGFIKPYNVLADEIVEQRDPYTKCYRNDDGSITAKISMTPVHYKNEDGSYGDIDLSIIKEKNGDFEYQAAKNTFRSYFNTHDSVEDFNMAGFDVMNSQGIQRSMKYKLVGATPKGHSVKGEKFVYHDVFPDIDLEYIVSSEKLKENVIVNKPLKDYVFNFLLDIDENVYLEELEDGDISFLYADTHEKLWKIESPYAFDSSKEKLFTQGARYEIGAAEYNGKEYTGVSLILEDEEFIENAKFPIIIDPTGTFSDTDSKTWSFGREMERPEKNYLKVGNNATRDGYWYCAVKFNFNLASNVTVNSAVMKMYVEKKSNAYKSKEKEDSAFDIFMIEEDRKKNSAVPKVGEAVKYKNSYYDFTVGAYNLIDMTKAVQSWVSKANPSFGVLFIPSNGDYNTHCSFSKGIGAYIEINYSEPVPDGNPKVKVLMPSGGQILQNGTASLAPKISVSDANNDTLTLRCFIDKEMTARSTKTVAGSASYKDVLFDAINISSLAIGSHTIRFEVSDGKSSPVVITEAFYKAGIKYESSISSIKLMPFDRTSYDSPEMFKYNYTIDTISTGWVNDYEYIMYNLKPNTKYTAKLEIQNASGQKTAFAQNIYTKAQMPEAGVSKLTRDSFDLYVEDGNPATTQYQIMINGKYLTNTGTFTTTANWIVLSGKKITVKGLSTDTLYSIRAKARSEENVETPFCNPTSVTTLK